MATKADIWSDAYVEIASSLTEFKPFKRWLAGQLNAGARDRKRASYEPSNWRKNSHVHALLKEKDARNTLGILVAFVLPHSDSLRFAFALTDDDLYRQWRTPFRKAPRPKPWFPEKELFHHRHLQMTFSHDGMAPTMEEGIPVYQSMMLASFKSGQMLYCDDAHALSIAPGSRPHVVPVIRKSGEADKIGFRSINRAAELAWGLRSILYIPIYYDSPRGDHGIILSIYSPVPGVFGKVGRAAFQYRAPPIFVQEFCKKHFPKLLYEALVLSDEQTRNAVERTLRQSYEKVRSIWQEKIPNDLSLYFQEQLTQIPAVRPLKSRMLADVERIVREGTANPHLGVLQAVTEFDALSATDKLSYDDLNNLVVFLEQIVKSRNAEEPTLILNDGRGLPKIEFRYDKNGFVYLQPTRQMIENSARMRKLLEIIAVAFLDNFRDYGRVPPKKAGSPAVLRLGQAEEGFAIIEMRNTVQFTRSLVQDFWAVKEGLLPSQSPNRKRGVQLFALRALSRGAPIFKFTFGIDNIDDSFDYSEWISAVTFPVQAGNVRRTGN